MIVSMLPALAPYIIYIHGFNSSPASFKAAYLKNYLSQIGCAESYVAPALDYRPQLAIEQLCELIEQYLSKFNITLIGSSLGGYYATYLTEKYGVNSVLINPAVAPYRMMAQALGKQRNYHTQQRYDITQREVDQLRQIEQLELTDPNKYLVLLQTGDDTLDYREAAHKYANSKLIIRQGGSHGFDHFDQAVPDILHFAGLVIN
ncbi:MAG: esterase [Pseudomonadales bacterium]|nr:esterase [Pseudomonadales bacterium]MCP5213748.1 esterase [Pseudomonadales bacterium]